MSIAVIERLGARVPILGVCLGHQSIGQAYGGDVVRAGRIMHGKTSRIRHEGKGVFAGLPDGYEATRYHSLVVDKRTLPDCLEVTAWTEHEDGSIEEIMGLRHREHPVQGVQFHPESILTEHGACVVEEFPGAMMSFPSGEAGMDDVPALPTPSHQPPCREAKQKQNRANQCPSPRKKPCNARSSTARSSSTKWSISCASHAARSRRR